MRLIIGGTAQGKRAFALSCLSPAAGGAVCDGGACPLENCPRAQVLDKLHLLVRRLLESGREPAAFVEETLRQNPGILIVCDEIGCGVVPCGAAERAWREETGRILCHLAARAERVDRVFCGLAQRIK